MPDAGSRVGHMGIDILGVAVPQHRGAVDIEGHLTAIGQERRVAVTKGNSSAKANDGGSVRYPL